MAGANVETVAKAMNITPRRVQQLAADGMPKATRGEYDLGQCMAWYIRYLQKAIEKRSDPGKDDGTLEFTRERSRLAKEQADKAALDNAARRGELLEANIVERAWTELFTAIKARALSLPTKVAAELATMTDANRIRDRLHREVHEILSEAAAYRLEPAADDDPEDRDDGPGDAEAATHTNGQSVGGRKQKAKQRKQRRARTVAH